MPEVYEELGLKTGEFNKIKQILGRDPNFLETVLYSLLWSEHCAYKHSRSKLKKLPTAGPQVIQGPGENAGVVDIGDGYGIAFKMESHNHPSAIEPFNGAATGVGGIIRDVLSMNARPIAMLNSLRFGPLTDKRTKHLFEEVVRGIASYGNCTGIPTVGGEIYFEEAYTGNPLVNAMCVGLLKNDEIMRGFASGIGNLIVLFGSKTGRDGIGGASVLASAEFDETASEKRPSVQVGDPFTKKLLIEASLEIMKDKLAVGVQDLGAAGIASSASDMAGRAGNGVELDTSKVPQREPGMKAWEIIVSESQERMLAVVVPEKFDALKAICDKYDLDCVVMGKIIPEKVFRVVHDGVVEGEVPVASITDDLPVYDVGNKRPAYLDVTSSADLSGIELWPSGKALTRAALPGSPFDASPDALPDFASPLEAAFLTVLASPNICSRKWVFTQYDHMVQTNTAVLPGHDAAVIRIKGTNKAIALAADCNGRFVYLDPNEGAKIAVAECIRNLISSGARPLGLTDCLNFGSPEKPEIYWQFELALDGLAESSLALQTPFVSGNVSFYNESFGEAIYPTPTIGAVGLIDDIDTRTDIAFKNEGDLVYIIGGTYGELGGSEFLKSVHGQVTGAIPKIDLELEKRTGDAILSLIGRSLIRSCHDISDGGLLITLAEKCILGGIGARIDLTDYRSLCDKLPRNSSNTNTVNSLTDAELYFSESQSRYIVSVDPAKKDEVEASLIEMDKSLEANSSDKTDKAISASLQGKSNIITFALIGTVGGKTLSIVNTLDNNIDNSLNIENLSAASMDVNITDISNLYYLSLERHLNNC